MICILYRLFHVKIKNICLTSSHSFIVQNHLRNEPAACMKILIIYWRMLVCFPNGMREACCYSLTKNNKLEGSFWYGLCRRYFWAATERVLTLLRYFITSHSPTFYNVIIARNFVNEIVNANAIWQYAVGIPRNHEVIWGIRKGFPAIHDDTST